MSMLKVISSEREKKPRVWKNEKYVVKVDFFLRNSQDYIPLPSHCKKIQIMGGKDCLRGKDQTTNF